MRITNAIDAEILNWPWFVLISKRGKSGSWRHVCGASLIDKGSKSLMNINYVYILGFYEFPSSSELLLDSLHAVSAAHCFISEDFISGVGFIPTNDYQFYLNHYSHSQIWVI